MLMGGSDGTASVTSRGSRFEKAMRLEWLGQTIASICWIVSMLIYGLESSADWLQLMAASAWLLANIAALLTAES